MTIKVKDFIPLTTLIIISSTLISLYFINSLSTNSGDFLRYVLFENIGDRISNYTLLKDPNIFEFLKEFISDPSIIGLKLIDIIVGPNNQNYGSRILRLTIFSFINYYFYLFTVYSKSAKYKFICTLGAISTLSVDLFFGQLRNSYAYVFILIIIWIIERRRFNLKIKIATSLLFSFIALAFHLSTAFIIPFFLLTMIFDLKIKRKVEIYIISASIMMILLNKAFSIYNSNYGREAYTNFSGFYFLIFSIIFSLIIYFYRNKLIRRDLILSLTLSIVLINICLTLSITSRFIAMILPLLIIYTSRCEKRTPSLLFLLLSLGYSTYNIIS